MRDIIMALGRILMSAIFLQAGFSELIGLGATIGYFEALDLPFPWITVWIVLAIEILGGFAILIGYRTRLAAGTLGVFSIAAGFIGHSQVGNPMELQALMKDIAIAGGLFYIAVTGAGLLSFDARLEE